MGIALGALGLAALVAGAVFVRRHEDRLADAAERAMPGPVFPRRGHGTSR